MLKTFVLNLLGDIICLSKDVTFCKNVDMTANFNLMYEKIVKHMRKLSLPRLTRKSKNNEKKKKYLV